MTSSNVFYVSSKLRHRHMWLNSGINTNSSWIQSEQIEDSDELSEMWIRYLDELMWCDGLIMYLEPGDVPKGCLIELGAAMSNMKPIFIVWAGDIKDLEKVMGTIIYHRSVTILPCLPVE